jgi:hypothetical protein
MTNFMRNRESEHAARVDRRASRHGLYDVGEDG